MAKFNVKWAVYEVLNGDDFDSLRKHGHRYLVANGQVEKESQSRQDLESDLLAALRGSFPEHEMGPTYDIDRIYEIDIEEVK